MTMNIRLLLATLVAALLPLASHATTVRALDIDGLLEGSAVVFEGTCTGNRTERDPATNLVVTYTTFAVHDALKGAPGATHVIKQVGGELDDGSPVFRIQGVPKFVPGRDYVVFLPPASSLGFSSPTGLAQGRFNVTRDEAGAPRVANGRDFRELTARIPPRGRPDDVVERLRGARQPARDLDLAEFKELVRERARDAK